MIVVEGPDGSGKTTLAKRLAENLNISIQPKAVDDHGRYMTNMMDWTKAQLNQGFREVIYDRFNLISDPIYRPFLGGYVPEMYDIDWIRSAMHDFYRVAPIIIYCMPLRSTVMYNIAHGEDDNSAVAQYGNEIWFAYAARMARDFAPPEGGTTMWYDYERHSYGALLNLIKFQLKRRNNG